MRPLPRAPDPVSASHLVPLLCAQVHMRQATRLYHNTSAECSSSSSLPACEACGREGVGLLCEPCGCRCCEACIWLQWLRPAVDDGSLRCPKCNAQLPSPEELEAMQAEEANAAGGEAPRRVFALTAESGLAAGAGEHDWTCVWCFYANFNRRLTCRSALP